MVKAVLESFILENLISNIILMEKQNFTNFTNPEFTQINEILNTNLWDEKVGCLLLLHFYCLSADSTAERTDFQLPRHF